VRDGGKTYLNRFSKSERAVHWIHAAAFFVLLGSGLVLYLPSLAGIGNRGVVKDVHLYTAIAWALALLAVVVFGDRKGLRRTGLRSALRRLGDPALVRRARHAIPLRGDDRLARRIDVDLARPAGRPFVSLADLSTDAAFTPRNRARRRRAPVGPGAPSQVGAGGPCQRSRQRWPGKRPVWAAGAVPRTRKRGASFGAGWRLTNRRAQLTPIEGIPKCVSD
jgi:hypothetical protein